MYISLSSDMTTATLNPTRKQIRFRHKRVLTLNYTNKNIRFRHKHVFTVKYLSTS